VSIMNIPDKWQWFSDSRFGMFIHFGPYAAYGRGEQVLFREQLDHKQYAAQAARWNPRKYDPGMWAHVAQDAGMRYCVMTARHHDGYCLWDSQQTDYTSVQLAPKRDLIGEYVEAVRGADLRVGLYYSLADWRIPAYWAGPQHDPQGWARFQRYVHAQLDELLSHYGQIDLLWFDGAWPNSGDDWGIKQIVSMARKLQPSILINNRLDMVVGETGQNEHSDSVGDFTTSEHNITPDPSRLWESCQTSTWRLWGYTAGERWRSADVLLGFLVEAASFGGNLLLNVGPKANGTLPKPFIKQMDLIGAWLRIHGEAIYGTQRGDVCEFISYGFQTQRDNNLYLIIRFWDGCGTVHLAGLKTRVESAVLLTTGEKLIVRQEAGHVYIEGLPRKSPTRLFPVIKLNCESKPEPTDLAQYRLWTGEPKQFLPWAHTHGEGAMMDGQWKR
jgi:alpha-L-fucosidase